MQKDRSLGSRLKKRVHLKGHYRAREQSDGPRVLIEVGQNAGAVEEAHHGHSSGHIHAIDVIAVDQGVEGLGAAARPLHASLLRLPVCPSG